LAVESIKKERLNAVKRGIRLKYVIEITKENIVYCKEKMKISEVRHADGVKGNFEVMQKNTWLLQPYKRKNQLLSLFIACNELVEQ
jgi:hypothetical protein